MIQLIDGPCQGMFLVKSAPVFVRAVKDQLGETDLLDQVADIPKKSETIYVYKLEGTSGHFHIRAKNASGWYAYGQYRWMPEVDGEKLRDTAAWQEWVIRNFKGEC